MNYLLRDVVNRAQNAADTAWCGLVRHGAVCDGEIRLFQKAVAMILEKNVFVPGRGAAFKGRCKSGDR